MALGRPDGQLAASARVVGHVMFGYGMVCWFVLGSIILARLFFRPALPAR